MRLYYIFLIFTGLVVGLLIGEFSLRLYQLLGEKFFLGLTPNKTTVTWQNNLIKKNGWFVTPSKEYFNYIEPNSQGFFDSEHEFKKPKGVYRIILLGDSFVASLQTPKDKTVGKLLEKNLNNAGLSNKFEVISIGLGDTGTAQQYLALKNTGIKYSPDLVVHLFLTANDIKNNSYALQNDPYRPYYQLTEHGMFQFKPSETNHEHKLKLFLKKLSIVELFLSLRQSYIERRVTQDLDYPIDYYVYNKNYDWKYLEAWKITKALILASESLTLSRNSNYILAVSANNEQVNNDVWSKLQIKYPKLIKQTDLKKPDKILNEFCANQKLDCVFMLPEFQKYVTLHPRNKTHYKFDGHWNKIGTILAAEVLSKYIIKKLDN